MLASFYLNGTSFLGYAIVAEKRGLSTQAQGVKSLYYSNGLLEGTETIVYFVSAVPVSCGLRPLSWVFGGLCYVTATLRLMAHPVVHLTLLFT